MPINIGGTLNLIEASRKNGVKKFIFASSGGAIYGEQEAYPADESHPTRPVNPYGIGKYTVEQYLKFYQHEHGIPFVSLRYANVYGPRQRSEGEGGVVAIFCDKLLQGEAPAIYGDGQQTRDFVFVDDVVHCNLEAFRPEVSGIFNVGTGVETDVNTLARELIQIIGADVASQYAPPQTRRAGP